MGSHELLLHHQLCESSNKDFDPHKKAVQGAGRRHTQHFFQVRCRNTFPALTGSDSVLKRTLDEESENQRATFFICSGLAAGSSIAAISVLWPAAAITTSAGLVKSYIILCFGLFLLLHQLFPVPVEKPADLSCPLIKVFVICTVSIVWSPM